MAEVLTLTPEIDTPPLHRKIRLRSRWVIGLLNIVLGCVFALAAMTIVVGFFFPEDIGAGPNGGEMVLPFTGEHLTAYPGFIRLSELPWGYRLGLTVAILLRTVPTTLAMLNLRALFKLYAAGTVFARENAERVKWLGIWLMVGAVEPALTWHTVQLAGVFNPDKLWFHQQDVYALITGALLLVVAQVMQVGHEIEQDREQFV